MPLIDKYRTERQFGLLVGAVFALVGALWLWRGRFSGVSHAFVAVGTALFLLGLVLLGIEIFLIPGFGVLGISGVLLILAGLGLATVYSIVEQNGGCIFVDTSMGRGTTFRIYLPRIDEVVETPAVQAPKAKLEQASETILLVEDELGLRTVVDESLRQEGYRVLLAANGMDALDVAAQHQGPIQLLITDVIMPFVSGPELAQSLKALRPETRVLYISGYTADKFADYPKLDPDLALLQKPFKLGDLAQKVRDLLNEKAENPRSKQKLA